MIHFTCTQSIIDAIKQQGINSLNPVSIPLISFQSATLSIFLFFIARLMSIPFFWLLFASTHTLTHHPQLLFPAKKTALCFTSSLWWTQHVTSIIQNNSLHCFLIFQATVPGYFLQPIKDLNFSFLCVFILSPSLNSARRAQRPVQEECKSSHHIIWRHRVRQFRQICKWVVHALILIWQKHRVGYLKCSFHCDKSNLAQLRKRMGITLSSW